MRTFLSELASLEGGFPDEIVEQGEAMLRALERGVERAGHETVVPEEGPLDAAIGREAPDCDAGLAIAPDHLLAEYTSLLEAETKCLGPSPEYVELAADKLATLETLEGEVPTPGLEPEGEAVVKPVTGAGAEGVRLTEEEPGEGEFAEEYVEGSHASVVLVEGKPVALSQQLVSIEEREFVYRGNRAPFRHPLAEEAFDVAERAASLLGSPRGIVGVDLVLADEPGVVEVNPRPTVSVVPLEQVMRPSPAELLVEGLPRRGELTFRGEAEFRC